MDVLIGLFLKQSRGIHAVNSSLLFAKREISFQWGAQYENRNRAPISKGPGKDTSSSIWVRYISLFPLIARFMGPIWGRQDPCGRHVGPMNLAIWVRSGDQGTDPRLNLHKESVLGGISLCLLEWLCNQMGTFGLPAVVYVSTFQIYILATND